MGCEDLLNSADGVPPRKASGSLPSAVAVAPSAEAADQGLQAANAPAHEPEPEPEWVVLTQDKGVRLDGTPWYSCAFRTNGSNNEFKADFKEAGRFSLTEAYKRVLGPEFFVMPYLLAKAWFGDFAEVKLTFGRSARVSDRSGANEVSGPTKEDGTHAERDPQGDAQENPQ